MVSSTYWDTMDTLEILERVATLLPTQLKWISIKINLEKKIHNMVLQMTMAKDMTMPQGHYFEGAIDEEPDSFDVK